MDKENEKEKAVYLFVFQTEQGPNKAQISWIIDPHRICFLLVSGCQS